MSKRDSNKNRDNEIKEQPNNNNKTMTMNVEDFKSIKSLITDEFNNFRLLMEEKFKGMEKRLDDFESRMEEQWNHKEASCASHMNKTNFAIEEIERVKQETSIFRWMQRKPLPAIAISGLILVGATTIIWFAGADMAINMILSALGK